MNRVVCNIPHAGKDIPNWALTDFITSQEKLQNFADFMADKDVDKLFDFVPCENKVVAEISRVVLDTERFRSDDDEPMAKLGMGLFYTKDDKGNSIRNKGQTYKRCLELYDSYHKELENKVSKSLKANNSCFILDCHSFHDKMEYTGYSTSDFPDICLGFNEQSPFAEIIWMKNLFEESGYEVKLNMPFSGALVPLTYWGNCRIKAAMIEINRRVYDGSAEDFSKMQSLCRTIYDEFSI